MSDLVLGVVGIGNTLMSDDGIGPILLERLEKSHPDIEGVRYIHGGTGGMNLIHILKDFDRALIIDCADMGLDPGEFRIFSPDEVETVKFVSGGSLHDVDIMRVIEISMGLGEAPDPVIIFAVQPRSIGMGEGISRELSLRMNEYMNAILTEMRSLADI